MHEHVFSLYPEVRIQDAAWDEEARVAEAVAAMREVHARGIRTIVDMTVYGLGRNLTRIRTVAERSGMNILAATGLYFFSEMPSYFRRRLDLQSLTFIEDLLVAEIESGVFDTGIRAAVIKCVTDQPGMTPDAELAFRAAARSQLRTGVPIATHSQASTRGGLEQQRVLREEGVDLGRVIIGHSGDSTDLAYLEQLINAGSYLGMDRFGSYRPPCLKDRVETVVALCERGYADRLVLSHDTNCWSDKVPEHLRGTSPECSPAAFTFVTDEVLPMLRAAGISEASIHRMLVANPRAIFTGRG